MGKSGKSKEQSLWALPQPIGLTFERSYGKFITVSALVLEKQTYRDLITDETFEIPSARGRNDVEKAVERFMEMKEGDLVATLEFVGEFVRSPVLAVGRIESGIETLDYSLERLEKDSLYYDEFLRGRHRRRVEWLKKESIDRIDKASPIMDVAEFVLYMDAGYPVKMDAYAEEVVEWIYG